MISFKSFICESRQKNTQRKYRVSRRIRRSKGQIKVQRNVFVKNKALPNLKRYRLVKKGNKTPDLVRMSSQEIRHRSKRNPLRAKGFRKAKTAKKAQRLRKWRQSMSRRSSLGIKE